MGRILFAALFALLAGLLFSLPPADPTRVAALRVSELLAAPTVDAAADAAGAVPSAGASILASPAVQDGEGGQRRLRLAGVRIRNFDAPSSDLTVHGQARAALISGLRQIAAEREQILTVDGELMPAEFGAGVDIVLRDGALALRFQPVDGAPIESRLEGWRAPTRAALLPPLIAILLAILFRRPVLALFSGVWLAAFLQRDLASAEHGLASRLGRAVRALPDVATDLAWPQVIDPGRAQIIGFVIAMLAMVGVMTRAAGIRGLMDLVAKLARDARRTQVATWLLGLVVFFDDYANCILVGSTMRPLCDRFRIAREKLAYLVDSTAAPVAGLSIFSTWIAFEVSTFSAQLPAAGLLPSDGYAIFMQTLPYRFYCILTLVLSGAVCLSGRDFGPMLAAERRARSTGQLVRPGGKPMVATEGADFEPAAGVVARAHRALLPVLTFVGLTLFEIVRVGLGAMRKAHADFALSQVFSVRGITELLGSGNSTRALLIGSVSGFLLAVVLALLAGLRREIAAAAWATLRSMGIAIAILYLAWMIGAACDALGTAPYLTAMIGDDLPPQLLPAILFLMSALVAFSTGSSWSTMSILLPLVVGLAFNLGKQCDLGGTTLMVMSIGSVLEGSIFGDHCSPISDTTVLSSTSSASDHLDHVRTQIPYALTAMLAALTLGYLPCAFAGHHPVAALLGCIAAVLMILFVFGRKADSPASPARPS